MLDFLLKAPDRAAFESFAQDQGWLVERDKTLVPVAGISVDHIGPIVTTPGTYDDEGNEITAPVIDNAHHVNVRLDGEWETTERHKPQRDAEGKLLQQIDRTKTGELFKNQGSRQSFGKRPSHSYKLANGVELIDPATVEPYRIWLGGQEY